MSEERIKVSVNIYGTNYTLRGQPGTSREHIQKIAERVDGKMREIGEQFKSLDLPRIAVLTAVNMTDQYLRALEQLDEEKARIVERQQEEDQELKQLMVELTRLQQDHRQLTEQNKQLQMENDQLRKQYEELQEEYKKLQSEYNEWIQLTEESFQQEG